jgi:hypothetical protein
VKSAVLEIQGVSAAGAQSLRAELKRVSTPYGSDAGAATYALDSSGTLTPFTVLFNALTPPAGCSDCETVADMTTGATTYSYTFYLKPTGADAYVLSTKLILTYTYVQ